MGRGAVGPQRGRAGPGCGDRRPSPPGYEMSPARKRPGRAPLERYFLKLDVGLPVRVVALVRRDLLAADNAQEHRTETDHGRDQRHDHLVGHDAAMPMPFTIRPPRAKA